MKKFFLILFVGPIVASCQSTAFRSLPKVDISKPVKLALIPEIGREETTQFHSRAVNRVYKDGSLLKKFDDVLDFRVSAEVMKVDPMADRIEYSVKTVSKKGQGNLHEFAFPEPGEKLKLVVNSKTEVFEAGEHPKDSIFYVPTIPLPEDRVEKGDSWAMSADWITASQKFPMRMEVAGILKEYRKCDGSHCALIEISGDVKLNGIKDPLLHLKSEIRGYMLFSLQRGAVIWSHIRSDQIFTVGNVRNEMSSCLSSYVTNPKIKGLEKQVSPFCGPEAEIMWDQIPNRL